MIDVVILMVVVQERRNHQGYATQQIPDHAEGTEGAVAKVLNLMREHDGPVKRKARNEVTDNLLPGKHFGADIEDQGAIRDRYRDQEVGPVNEGTWFQVILDHLQDITRRKGCGRGHGMLRTTIPKSASKANLKFL